MDQRWPCTRKKKKRRKEEKKNKKKDRERPLKERRESEIFLKVGMGPTFIAHKWKK